MGFRLATRTADTIRLVAPTDDAVDHAELQRWSEAASDKDKNGKAKAPDLAAKAKLEAFRAYARGDSQDLAALPFRGDVRPVFLVVRPLNPRERSIAGCDGAGNMGAFNYDLCRLGLVAVEGLDGWQDSRESYHGIQVLTLDAVSQLPHEVAGFVANHVYALSRLPPFHAKS